MRTGRVQARHKALLAVWVRVLREAGVTVRTAGPNRHVERYMRDTHIHREGADARRMDIVLPGLSSVFRGSPLFMDATCVSPVRGDGRPQHEADARDGAVVERAAERNKNVDYPDVEASPHAELLCLGVETYGRWSQHPLRLVRELSSMRAAGVTQVLRNSVRSSYAARWWALLSIAVQRIVAETAARDSGADLTVSDASVAMPTLLDVLDFNRV